MVTRIVGDVHGKTMDYVKLVEDCEYSLQVGDMGFNYSNLQCLFPNRHKFFGGNHDNYDVYYNKSHSLGDYGVQTLGDLEFFFIRGADSIDKEYRIASELDGKGKSWWAKEQLKESLMDEAFALYKEEKPSVMVTHTCPEEISRLIGDPRILKSFGFDPKTFTTRTQSLLQYCFEEHKPDVWIFGHFHMAKDFEYKGTRFICLPELAYIDYDSEFR